MRWVRSHSSVTACRKVGAGALIVPGVTAVLSARHAHEHVHEALEHGCIAPPPFLRNHALLDERGRRVRAASARDAAMTDRVPNADATTHANGGDAAHRGASSRFGFGVGIGG